MSFERVPPLKDPVRRVCISQSGVGNSHKLASPKHVGKNGASSGALVEMFRNPAGVGVVLAGWRLVLLRTLVDAGFEGLPTRSAGIAVVGPSPVAVVYAVTRSVFAPWVTLSPALLVPLRVSDVTPVMDVVGNVPMSPVIVVGPVLVMPWPARTAKLSAVPRPTAVGAATALDPSAKSNPTMARASALLPAATRECARLVVGIFMIGSRGRVALSGRPDV